LPTDEISQRTLICENKCVASVTLGTVQRTQTFDSPFASGATKSIHHVEIIVVYVNTDARILLFDVFKSFLQFQPPTKMTKLSSTTMGEGSCYRIKITGGVDIVVGADNNHCLFLLSNVGDKRGIRDAYNEHK
jgi:hypothetical protein